MKIDLSGRVAIVTGGAQGIGKAVVEAILGCGGSVGILDRDVTVLDDVVSDLNGRHPGCVVGVRADVSSQSDVIDAVAAVVAALGPVDLAVNNAGIAGLPGPLHDTGSENWNNVLGVNLDGVGFALMAEIESMLQAGKAGSIVNIASVEAHTVLRGFTSYTTSKHAVRGLTKGAAVDYAPHGIRINSVSPGVTATPLTMADGQREVTERLAENIPLARLGTPEDIAASVVFLLSDLSGYTTGADLVVDGGFLLRD
ncbi:hypothetical protein CH296_26650 [Rhodococcus sp. 14-2496-1d]|uniref:SDR family NAD(P)-dependent oxidoreductase n=1 Tax=Rhodococcus sp. 14-2496-1d TaxID=2023146 RepID=UPI000B9BAFD9|nr:SDR family oxidoreductase [Rhodococcus sp. 14-2496-1d]OZF25696.1 hypothetical protein CH296_26650 [Rhodococcus sp. 14-2496-1d]